MVTVQAWHGKPPLPQRIGLHRWVRDWKTWRQEVKQEDICHAGGTCSGPTYTSKWSGNLSCFSGLCCFCWVRWVKSELGKHGGNSPLVPGCKPSMPWQELISSQVVLPPFWVRECGTITQQWWQHSEGRNHMCCRCHTYSCEMDRGGTLSLRRKRTLLPLRGCLLFPLLPRPRCWPNQLPFSGSTGDGSGSRCFAQGLQLCYIWVRCSERPLGKGYSVLTPIVTHPIFLHAVRSSEVPGQGRASVLKEADFRVSAAEAELLFSPVCWGAPRWWRTYFLLKWAKFFFSTRVLYPYLVS